MILVTKFSFGVDQFDDQHEDFFLPFQRYGYIDIIEGILLQIDHVDKGCLLIDDEVFQRDALFTGDLYHFINMIAVG